MKTISSAFLLVLVCLACKDKETSPIYTIVGSYRATIYDASSSRPLEYPISDHNLFVNVISQTDSTVNVEIVSTPPKTALPENVYVPSSIVYRDVLSIKDRNANNTTFNVRLSTVFGHPDYLNNAILFYGGTNFADYYYTPPATPTVTKTIRLVRNDQ